MVSSPATVAPESCPRAKVNEVVRSPSLAGLGTGESARPSLYLTEDMTSSSLLTMRMPSALELDRDRKHPLQAMGDAELLASCEERKAEKYSVVAAWHACIAVIQRRIAVCTSAAWLRMCQDAEAQERAAGGGGAAGLATPRSPAEGAAAAGGDGGARRGRRQQPPVEAQVNLAARANGHPVLRVVEGDATQQVTTFSLREILESIMVDQLTALGASAWVNHLQVSGKRWAMSATQAVKIDKGSAVKVPWFWHWAEARAREATAGQLAGAGAMRIRSAQELVGSTDFDPMSISFAWLSWLARLGLLVAGKHDPAGGQMLAMVWAGVNRAYLTAERDTHKMFRHAAVMPGSGAARAGGGASWQAASPGPSSKGGAGGAAAASGGGAGKRSATTSPARGSKREGRARCPKCTKWHTPGAACPSVAAS